MGESGLRSPKFTLQSNLTKQTMEECFDFLFCTFHVELILEMPSPGVCIAALFPLLGGAPLGAELGSVLGSSTASREQLQVAAGLIAGSGASLQEAAGLGSCWSHCTSGRRSGLHHLHPAVIGALLGLGWDKPGATAQGSVFSFETVCAEALNICGAFCMCRFAWDTGLGLAQGSWVHMEQDGS